MPWPPTTAEEYNTCEIPIGLAFTDKEGNVWYTTGNRLKGMKRGQVHLAWRSLTVSDWTISDSPPDKWNRIELVQFPTINPATPENEAI